MSERSYHGATSRSKKEEGNVLFNDAYNTFYLWLYVVSHMVEKHSDSERGNPLMALRRLLFSISSKGSTMGENQTKHLENHELTVEFVNNVGKKEMFYLTTYSTHFIYGYMSSSVIW